MGTQNFKTEGLLSFWKWLNTIVGALIIVFGVVGSIAYAYEQGYEGYQAARLMFLGSLVIGGLLSLPGVLWFTSNPKLAVRVSRAYLQLCVVGDLVAIAYVSDWLDCIKLLIGGSITTLWLLYFYRSSQVLGALKQNDESNTTKA